MKQEPKIDPEFRAYAEEQGWRCFTEYVPPSEDVDENGEMLGGFWTAGIVHEEKIGDELHMFVLEFGLTGTFLSTEGGRRGLIELAEAGWREYLEGIPS